MVMKKNLQHKKSVLYCCVRCGGCPSLNLSMQQAGLTEEHLRQIKECHSLEDLEKLLLNIKQKKAQQTAALQTAVTSLVTESDRALRCLYDAKSLSENLEMKFSFFIYKQIYMLFYTITFSTNSSLETIEQCSAEVQCFEKARTINIVRNNIQSTVKQVEHIGAIQRSVCNLLFHHISSMSLQVRKTEFGLKKDSGLKKTYEALRSLSDCSVDMLSAAVNTMPTQVKTLEQYFENIPPLVAKYNNLINKLILAIFDRSIVWFSFLFTTLLLHSE